jgi:hypothetical protein
MRLNNEFQLFIGAPRIEFVVDGMAVFPRTGRNVESHARGIRVDSASRCASQQTVQ